MVSWIHAYYKWCMSLEHLYDFSSDREKSKSEEGMPAMSVTLSS